MSGPPFIALEGIDGAGKSAQCRLLADWLHGRGLTVTQVADPGGTAVGDQLRRMVLGGQWEMGRITEALLFMASRAELVNQIIRPALRAGTPSYRIVFCSRMSFIRGAREGSTPRNSGGSDDSQPGGWNRI